jgi:predicted HAD superfamily Cof-like phosphohydrolase
MSTNFELVGDFMEAVSQEVNYAPQWVDPATIRLRVALIEEEFEELKEAIADKNLVEVADALTDLLYVIYGAGHSFGIDLYSCFTEVHSSNMSKMGEDGRPIKGFNGKIMKGPNYFSPDLEKVLFIS